MQSSLLDILRFNAFFTQKNIPILTCYTNMGIDSIILNRYSTTYNI